MTIKTTLAYGRNFHFYQEGLNSNYIYLELEDAPYDVGYRRIMIAIPVDVWETIRVLGSTQLDLVNSSDTDIIEFVERKVTERIADYERIRSASPDKASTHRFDDFATFGPADEDREKQIKRGIEYYKAERERQRGIIARMVQHKIIEIGTEALENK